VNFLRVNSRNRIEFGVEIKNEAGDFDYLFPADTNNQGGLNAPLNIRKTISSLKAGGFIQYNLLASDKISMTLGIRGDYYGLSRRTEVSPRIELGYSFSPLSRITLNGGILHQQLPLILLSGDAARSSLSNVRCQYYGAGYELILTADTRLTLDAYSKEYSNMPLDPGDPTNSVIEGGMFNTRFTRYDGLVSSGKAFTRGAELIIQKKIAEDLYGLISASYFRSRYMDYNGVWRDRIYDNKLIFSAIGGYKLNREWEFSIRWTYGGGIPYTPFDEKLSAQYNIGIPDRTRANEGRLPDYHTLNVRVDRKFYFNNQYLNIYFSLMNAYNRKNVMMYNWNPIEKKSVPVEQWSLLPIFGVEYEI
jgi:hypothetical protein